MTDQNKQADRVTNSYCDGLVDLAAMDHVGPSVADVLRDCAKQIRHLQAYHITAQDAADQRQSEIVAWLREFDNHPPTPNCPRCNAADAIESGAWMADRTNGGIG